MSASADGQSQVEDESVPVRDEDEFDLGAVTSWLRERAGPEHSEIVAGTPQVRQFPGGASNLTYLLRYPDGDLILRRPPMGSKARGAHDMAREHTIQAALHPVFSLVPAMVAFCDDPDVIGSDFYVMERVDGLIPRRDLPQAISPAQTSRLCGQAWDVLVDLHSVDVSAVPELAALSRGGGYVARQVGGWTSRLARSATDDLGDWSVITDWLDREQPGDVGQCVVHNDFRFDNLVLSHEEPHRVIAVLDWELATVGDPLMDLGGSMAYWITDADDEFMRGFRRQPSNAPGMWSREQIVERYCERRALELSRDQWQFYEVFGTFRLAVIAQQDLVPLLPPPDHQPGVRRLRPRRRCPRTPLPRPPPLTRHSHQQNSARAGTRIHSPKVEQALPSTKFCLSGHLWRRRDRSPAALCLVTRLEGTRPRCDAATSLRQDEEPTGSRLGGDR